MKRKTHKFFICYLYVEYRVSALAIGKVGKHAGSRAGESNEHCHDHGNCSILCVVYTIACIARCGNDFYHQNCKEMNKSVNKQVLNRNIRSIEI